MHVVEDGVLKVLGKPCGKTNHVEVQSRRDNHFYRISEEHNAECVKSFTTTLLYIQELNRKENEPDLVYAQHSSE